MDVHRECLTWLLSRTEPSRQKILWQETKQTLGTSRKKTCWSSSEVSNAMCRGRSVKGKTQGAGLPLRCTLLSLSPTPSPPHKLSLLRFVLLGFVGGGGRVGKIRTREIKVQTMATRTNRRSHPSVWYSAWLAHSSYLSACVCVPEMTTVRTNTDMFSATFSSVALTTNGVASLTKVVLQHCFAKHPQINIQHPLGPTACVTGQVSNTA